MTEMSLDKLQVMDFLNTIHKSKDISLATKNAVEQVADLLSIQKVTMNVSIRNEAHEEITIFERKSSHSSNHGETKIMVKSYGKIRCKIFYSQCDNICENNLLSLDYISKILLLSYEKYRYSEEIKFLEHHDKLTGLLNTKGYILYVQSILSNDLGCNYTSFYLNVFQFKRINKIFGYQYGNIALTKISTMMSDFIKEDGRVGRLGGDYFIAFIKNERVEDFIKLISNMKISLENEGVSTEYSVTLNAGVYKVTEKDKLALPTIDYPAIAFGTIRNLTKRGVVYYNDSMHNYLLREKEIIDIMKNALIDGEFTVLLQPKVSLKDYTVNGAEALVRWKQQGEFISPSEFIPIFEKNGYIKRVDYFVLQSVCEILSKWIKKGIEPVPVSVNFSRVHLNDENFFDKVVGILKKYGIESRLIEIEFTETSYINNFDNLISATKSFNDYGIKISMDDFGTGYSSLNMLKDVPINVLKLDKEFLKKEGTTERQKIIIRNIIKMAKELDLEVISEGVETVEQAIFLKDNNCDTAQGYLFDKPLSFDEFLTRLSNRQYPNPELSLYNK